MIVLHFFCTVVHAFKQMSGFNQFLGATVETRNRYCPKHENWVLKLSSIWVYSLTIVRYSATIIRLGIKQNKGKSMFRQMLASAGLLLLMIIMVNDDYY